MCSLTTAVGFVSLSTSKIPALRDFGVVAGISTMVSFALAFMVAAVAARVLPRGALIADTRSPTSFKVERWIDAYANLIFKAPWLLLGASIVLFATGSLGLIFLVPDMDVVGQFPVDSAIRVATRFVEENNGGTELIVVSVQHEEADAFLEPENLRRLDRVATYLRREVGATQVVSIADYIRTMHRALMDEDPAEARIPERRDQVAELMLLNGDDTTDQYINQTYSWVRLVARVPAASTRERLANFEQLDRFLVDTFKSDRRVVTEATGDSRIWAAITAQIVGSQIKSFSASFMLVFVPIFLMFRSWKAGLFSIPSNLFPIGITLGLMGWFNINLDVATANIASVVLGIVVDDTIHFIDYMRVRLYSHGDPARALRETLQTKGVGVSWVTLILGLGFAVTALSSFAPTRHFGILTCVALMAGAIGELCVLPPLCVVTGTRLGIVTVRPPPLTGGDSAC